MLPAGPDGNDLTCGMVIGPCRRREPACWGFAVVYGCRINSPNWRLAAAIGALLATVLMTMPRPARAEGLFDFFFGGFRQRPSPPANVNSYAEPPASIGRVAPQSPSGTESVRQGGEGIGRAVAFCVRLCDGQHFPLEHLPNATPVETCRAMCPTAKTKVFFGGEIGGSVARDGQRYTDIDNAFLYRKQLVANCTCNGKDAFGLARFDLSSDSTLRPGDIVATKDGFVAYSGARGQNAFTPVDPAGVAAQLVPGSPHVKLSRRAAPPAADDEPGTIVPARPPIDPGAQSSR
jgi:hypothetical protein